MRSAANAFPSLFPRDDKEQGGSVVFSDGYVAWLVCQERNKDRLPEAERYRLVKQALAGHRERDRVLSRALSWLGRCLVAWGRRLQEPYGVVVDSAAACCRSEPVS